MYKIEICANSVESAVNAQAAGAHRVELCAGLPEGGTTPSLGTIATARELLTDIQLNILIRLRGGDFLYTAQEQQIMMRDVEQCARIGVDGIVFGCLNSDGFINTTMLDAFVKMAHEHGMNFTFHRAFDVCHNPMQALEELINAGCDRILTSGQAPTAEQGIPLIAELVAKAASRIIVMPGCGVSSSNIKHIADATSACEFHLSARSNINSNMTYRNPKVSMGGTVTIDEYGKSISDINKIREAVNALKP